MNTMEQLENQLRSWTPRRPSVRLRDNIFGPPTDELRVRNNGTWLVVASAGALALVVALRQIPPATPVKSHTSPALLAAAMSNQNLAAYVSGQAEQRWNQPAATSFRWTNLGDSLYPASFPGKGKINQ